MNISIDISMYPLREDFEKTIIAFIETLRASEFRVEENGLSTQIFGSYFEVMDFLKENIHRSLLDQENCVFVMKIVTGDRREHEPDY
jgi:uncharacterized protein YqgV (UPF0045/DUF77 family)